MHFRGTCSVQCFRPAYHNLSLTSGTPCFLQPLSSPTTRHSDVLTAVSRLTMHLQYVSSYHNVRGAHCVSDTHALGTTTLGLRVTVSERGYYVPSHHVGSFIFALLRLLWGACQLLICLRRALPRFEPDFRSRVQSSGQLNCILEYSRTLSSLKDNLKMASRGRNI
jgi:hypothetical protein